MNGLANALAPYQGAALALVIYAVTALGMGAAIVALAALVVRFWKPLDAATRYAIWYVALIAVVLGPLATTCAVRAATHVPSLADVAGALSAPPSARGPLAVAVRFSRPQIAVPAYAAYGAAGLWLLIVLGGAVRFVAGVGVLARLKRDALPLSPERRAELPLWRERTCAPNARGVRLCVSDAVDVPLAVGLFDGMIVLPRHVVDEFEPGDVDRFVLHELAHLERRDDWTAILQRVAQVVQFFNPAVHVIARNLDLEREIACDDRVVAATSDVRSYAIGLTRMAESTAWPHRALGAPAIFVTRKQLSLRVEELLARRRAVPPRVAVAPAAVALFASLGVVAAATVHAPSVGVAPRALPAGNIRFEEMKVLVLKSDGANAPAGTEHRKIVLRADAKTLEQLRAHGISDPKRAEQIVEWLDAMRLQQPVP
jgi:beta-lactamase regulating signal transducer with metallopeptidase domain